MRQIKTVKIDLEPGKTKDFVVKELTIKNILELVKDNPFFADPQKEEGQQVKKSANGQEIDKTPDEKGLFSELSEYGDGLKKIMEMSCDFSMEDLIELAPSDVNKIYLDFREVNKTFLKILERVKLIDAVNHIIDQTMTNFLEIVAT